MYTEEWILDFVNKQILLELEAHDVDSLAESTYFTDPVNRFVWPHPSSRPPPPPAPPPPPVAAPVDHAADDAMPAAIDDSSDGEGDDKPLGAGEGDDEPSKPRARKKAARKAASAVGASEAAPPGSIDRTRASEPEPNGSAPPSRPRAHRRYVESLRLRRDEGEGKGPHDSRS